MRRLWQLAAKMSLQLLISDREHSFESRLQSLFLPLQTHCQAFQVAIPKGARGHIAQLSLVFVRRPSAPWSDGCDVSFSYSVLLLREARGAPKPLEWLVQPLSVLENCFACSCPGRGLTVLHEGT
jgi:hypothetical protein